MSVQKMNQRFGVMANKFASLKKPLCVAAFERGILQQKRRSAIFYHAHAPAYQQQSRMSFWFALLKVCAKFPCASDR